MGFDQHTDSGHRAEFDQVIDREGTGALALTRAEHGLPPDATPLWVADMGFRTPPAVRRALSERVEHGIVGYSVPTEGYYGALAGWFERRHGWPVDARASVQTRGVVHAVHLAIESLSQPGEGVIVQTPAYPPFFDAVKLTGRRLEVNRLARTDRGWEIDFDDFEARARRAAVFILCSPHNPLGRVWTRAELTRLAEICLKHQVAIISDEIHQDFVYPPARHIVTAAIAPEVAAITTTCTAPSKTFNLAGLQLANVFVGDRAARQRLIAAYRRQGLSQHPALGLAACQAAYSGAADTWVDALVAYLDRNLALVEQFLAAEAPAVGFIRPQGTYFAWLDFRPLGLDAAELRRLVAERARLWLSDGPTFGPDGAGFMRLNTAVPRPVLANALARLAKPGDGPLV